MRQLYARHPNLISWAVLAAGMLAVLAWSARSVGLSAGQWLWLALATSALAGLCVWIISWEDDDAPADDGAGDTMATDDDRATEGAHAPRSDG